jgi:ribosomal protein S18 acetylase RimI-like enzyme
MSAILNPSAHSPSGLPLIRRATLADLDALMALEERCFTLDRISRRSFRHLLTRAHAETLVYELDGGLRGYVLLLFRQSTPLARLYSIATDPGCRGRGIGEALVRAAEELVLENDASVIRLEIRKDNAASIGMFSKLGYKPFGEYEGYYEDEQDALRFQKYLAAGLDPAISRVPFYQQTLDFTCGPSSLMMAMKALDPSLELNRHLELRLWRESTTIFMTSGPGGCGPHGLALAAQRRDFAVEVFLRGDGPFFLDSVRSPEKKEVMRLVQEEQIEEVAEAGIPVEYRRISARDLQAKFETGGIPVVLISSYRLYQEKFPHWVVVTGFDERYVYVSDPFVDYEADKTVTDCINIPILREDFDRMTRYGKSGQEAVLVLYPRRD